MRVVAARWRFPCPCCGHRVFGEAPGSYDICPVCFWEDDLSQLRWPDTDGGANVPSLIDAQANVARFGAMEWRFIRKARVPGMTNLWIPSGVGSISIATRSKNTILGLDYGALYPRDRTVFYYWRRGDEKLRILRSLQERIAAVCVEKGLTP